MAAAKTPPATTEQYLLTLDGPGFNGCIACYPIGLFPTTQEAVRVAANIGFETPDTSSALGSITESSASWPSRDNGEDLRPFGYSVQKIVGGKIVGYARIKPYDTYDPSDAGATGDIDAEQELDFS